MEAGSPAPGTCLVTHLPLKEAGTLHISMAVCPAAALAAAAGLIPGPKYHHLGY